MQSASRCSRANRSCGLTDCFREAGVCPAPHLGCSSRCWRRRLAAAFAAGLSGWPADYYCSGPTTGALQTVEPKGPDGPSPARRQVRGAVGPGPAPPDADGGGGNPGSSRWTAPAGSPTGTPRCSRPTASGSTGTSSWASTWRTTTAARTAGAGGRSASRRSPSGRTTRAPGSRASPSASG